MERELVHGVDNLCRKLASQFVVSVPFGADFWLAKLGFDAWEFGAFENHILMNI